MHIVIRGLTMLSLWLWTATSLWAAPSPDQLAHQVEAAQAGWLEEVNSVTIEMEMVSGFATGITTVSQRQKQIRNGRPVLVEMNDDEIMNGAAMHDELLIDLIRAARSIDADQLGGRSVYRVIVDDPHALREITQAQAWDEEIDAEFEPKQATLWIEQGGLLLNKMNVVLSRPSGGEMTMDIDFGNFTTVRGLPIARSMKMTMRGLDQVISPDELAEVREAMAEMKQQLAQMPEAQRAMMERMVAPQLAEFEKMMASGSTTMEMRVIDIQVE